MIKITLWGNPINPAYRLPASKLPPPLSRFFKNLDFFPNNQGTGNLFCFDI